ncbi:DUF6443 domain-containing protein [uncultured Aquimarina sp.]|uniref:DUF6443 domain-containing protein n=1 Tax=uncultured Aquimarina sp. TaxID=575652 RepID=UPI002623FAFE|nr:DUF6443 domain-containing protein [uncultured Aquimarina sp.]
MKSYIQNISIIACLLIAAISDAQSTDKNYVSTKVYQIPLTVSQTATAGDDDKIQTISYFDGLGRVLQENAVHAGGDKEDIITYHQYDQYGRENIMYLPFGDANNNGAYEINADSYAQEYHFDTHTDVGSRARFITFQNSPLNEVKKERLPMDRSQRTSFSQGEIEYENGFNSVEDNIRFYSVDYHDESDIVTYGSYLKKHPSFIIPDNRLYKKTTKDENWEPSLGKNHTVEEYTNPKGQVVLKRAYNNGENHDTYYVYDVHDNLSYVIPPLAAEKETLSQTDIDDLCYQYLYDYKQRLRMKKIPGKDWEYIIYDKLDRPVLTQDASLREDKKWLFTKYDAFDRVVYTGIHTHNNVLDQVAMQEEVNTYTVLNEVFNASLTWTSAGTKVQYSNTVFPTTNVEILTINYYDRYDVIENPNIANKQYPLVQDQITTEPVKGLSTYSKVKVLNQNVWIETKTLYDTKGRVIGVATNNPYLNTIDIIENKLDFTGKSIKTRTYHQKDDQTPIVTIDEFTYDHVARLATHHQRIGDHTLPLSSAEEDEIIIYETPENNSALLANNNIILKPGVHIIASSTNTFSASIAEGASNSELIASNQYNGIGQLEQKKVGNTESQPLQTVDYRYNIQGWLSGINNHSIREEDNFRDISTVTLGTGDLFGMQINYSRSTTDATPLYNGNISQIHWKTASVDNSQKTYKYQYDALNRITKATDNTNKYNLEAVSYDQNGNILALERKGPIDINTASFGVMDDLAYDYQKGNQLAYVSDTSGVAEGFTDGNTSGNDYLYDVNGNMTVDKNKDISLITYNHLNLPESIEFISRVPGAEKRIDYAYDATGVKLRKVVTNYPAVNTTEYAGNYIYESNYSLGLPLGPNNSDDKVLQFFNHPEGYIEPNGSGGFDYIYQYKDHLGNIRLSYSDKNNDGDIDLISGSAENEIVEEKNYYPFGLQHKGYNSTITSREHNYSIGGKEEQNELGLNWHDFGARNYDAALGRWMNIDPLAEQYNSLSPYNYVANNPIFYIDPDGQRIIFGFQTDRDGNRIGEQSVQNNINSGLGFDNVAQIDKNGNLTLNLTKEQRAEISKDKGKAAFLAVLDEGINAVDAKGNSADVNINIVENNVDIVVGGADSKRIDIGDISNVTNGEAVTQQSLFAHEIKEQFEIQVGTDGKPVNKHIAHERGEGVEKSITGFERVGMERNTSLQIIPKSQKRGLRGSRIGNPYKTARTGTTTFIYNNGNKTVRATMHIQNGNVTNIDQR